jgi:tight adherence protein B
MRRLRLVVLALLVALPTLLPAAAVGAQEALDVRIREAALDDDGTTRLIVGVGGDAAEGVLDGSAFTVSEQGEGIGGLEVEPLIESRVQPIQVALLIDVSGSMGGQPMEDTKEAATSFVEQVTAEGMQVALIAFSSTVETLVSFTTDTDSLTAAIDGLQAEGSTLLYDAIVQGAAVLEGAPGQHNMVLFSDGGDNGSTSTLEEAVAATQSAQAPVTAVALETDDLDPAALSLLVEETGGRSLSTADSAALTGAFQQVAEELASQYVITYSSAILEPSELDIVASVTAAGASATDEIVVVNPRLASLVAPEELPAATGPGPLIPFLGSTVGLLAGAAAAFVALAVILGVALSAATGNRPAKLLEKSLAASTGGAPAPSQTIQERTGFAGTAIAAKAREIADMLPKPEGFEEEMQLKIERAGWRLRVSEFLIISAAAGLGVAGLAFLLTGSWIGGIVGVLVGVFIPRLLLARRASKRQKAFLEQLPETLQLLSGSLRAGYGILQAIDTVVREADEPTASEFSRAIGEARLGMPLDEALESMAARLDSVDFRWVVLAINIQRQIGGNLADLLETVANTLRERAMVRRQIKTLSAEGRLSAIVLVALPIVLGIYMFFVNNEYMMLLFTRTIGLILVGIVSLLMLAGIFWMRKMIKIEV